MEGMKSHADDLTHWPLGDVIFKLFVWIDILNISYEIALTWVPQNTFNVKSTLVQIMAWCLTAPRHYLSQCWPRYMVLYDVTRLQWVNGKRDKLQCWCTVVVFLFHWLLNLASSMWLICGVLNHSSAKLLNLSKIYHDNYNLCFSGCRFMYG